MNNKNIVQLFKLSMLIGITLFLTSCLIEENLKKKQIKKTLGGHYMYAFSDYYKSPKHRTDWWTRFSTHEDAVKNFDGLALRVNWRNLEPKKDLYDFDFIEKSLEFAKKYNKKIILSLSWRTFWNKEEGLLLNAPDYVL